EIISKPVPSLLKGLSPRSSSILSGLEPAPARLQRPRAVGRLSQPSRARAAAKPRREIQDLMDQLVCRPSSRCPAFQAVEWGRATSDEYAWPVDVALAWSVTPLELEGKVRRFTAAADSFGWKAIK